MRRRLILFVTCCLPLLPGCGSLLASLNMGKIEDSPRERTVGQMIEDENIETKAMVNLHAANAGYHDAHLVAVSYDGFVLLAGQVNDETLKTKATDVVRKIRGVRRIYNELEISPPTSALTRTSDAWITTKIKSWLLSTSRLKNATVKVVTENGVVYLMGAVTQSEADLIAHEVSGFSGVRRVVRLFDTLP